MSLSTTNPIAKIAEIKGQSNWQEKQLPDLRTLVREMRSQALGELTAADSHDAAIEQAAQHMGFKDADIDTLTVETPMGEVRIQRSSIYHIVEKRQDARERYAKVALDTLMGPFEVWKIAYSNETYRLAFLACTRPSARCW